jgi:hypothetical protein
MSELLHRANDAGHALDAIQRSLRRFGRLFLQIRQILLPFRLANLREDSDVIRRTGGGFGERTILRKNELVTREYGLHEVHAIANELDRSVDLVGDPRCEPPHCFQFLSMPKLGLARPSRLFGFGQIAQALLEPSIRFAQALLGNADVRHVGNENAYECTSSVGSGNGHERTILHHRGRRSLDESVMGEVEQIRALLPRREPGVPEHGDVPNFALQPGTTQLGEALE